MQFNLFSRASSRVKIFGKFIMKNNTPYVKEETQTDAFESPTIRNLKERERETRHVNLLILQPSTYISTIEMLLRMFRYTLNLDIF